MQHPLGLGLPDHTGIPNDLPGSLHSFRSVEGVGEALAGGLDRLGARHGHRAAKGFARGLRRSAEYVLSYCNHWIARGRIEGFNNVISRAIHCACGVRNLDYLFLKLRQESLD